MTRWTTPDGMTVDVITRTCTGGPAAPGARDRYLDAGGDGQRYRVRHPNGIVAGTVRTVEELALLVDIAELTE